MWKRFAVGVCTAGIVAAVAASSGADSKKARITMKDDCDPATFNAVIGDGTCVGHGDTTFQDFIAELTAEKSVDDWEFDPDDAHVRARSSVTARNSGGEVHSFTEVRQFGGGLVPLLNDLSGAGDPRPECLADAASGSTFAPPGGHVTTDALAPGRHKFQCCIHPWMRATIDVGDEHHH